ncbi:calpain small subunit 2-like [Scyliorhinus canicula]|uniref:calpain small subunit 2-like n=1 Tax=Scyliorhinus canicula TaxID=7830 RepID=UPI0018F74E13|nr:calpain small subunit 2-like [Scyliorhinus canicula]
MSSNEMRVAVEEAGFQLNNQLSQIIVARYSDMENLVLDFDNFVSCLIRLEAIFKMFYALPKDGDGFIELGLNQWLTLVMG